MGYTFYDLFAIKYKTMTISFDTLPEAVNLIHTRLDKIEQMLILQTNKEEQEEFIDAQAAAKFLKLTLSTIYSKVYKKQVPYYKQGKRLYFSKKDLREYLEKGKVG